MTPICASRLIVPSHITQLETWITNFSRLRWN
jgi:hypothetical protein